MSVYHIGVDLHKSFSLITVIDEKGSVLDRTKVYSNREDLKEYFSQFQPGTPVTFEANGCWYWFSDFLEEMKMQGKMAHPKKVRLIAESVVKTDEIDSEVLAQLERMNYLPQSYIPSKEIREVRELLRYRMTMVRTRTELKNKVHGALAKLGEKHEFTDVFGKAGLEYLKCVELPAVYRMEINGYLKAIESIEETIKEAEKEIKKQAIQDDNAKLLMSIPGISYFSALLLAMEIGNIERFHNYKKLCSYAGVVSSTHQSADKIYHGHIIKDSNKYIRWCLIEAINKAKHRDPRMKWFYDRMARRKGRPKARIATARKILISIYYMLKHKKVYVCEGYKEKVLMGSRLG